MESKFCFIVLIFFGLSHGVSQASECTARGRFLNDENDDCRGYTMCLMGGLTNFTQYKLVCPMGSLYSHIEQQCTNSTNYKCYPNFNCSSVGIGKFPVPESTDCSSFVACVEGLGGLGTARVVGCPTDMLFNPLAGLCVNNTEFTCMDIPLNVDMNGATVNIMQFSLLLLSCLLSCLLSLYFN